MKKKLLFISGLILSSLSFGQIYYDGFDPVGWKHSLLNVYKGTFTSVSHPSVSFVADGDAMVVNYDTTGTAGVSESIQFETYDVGGTGQKDVVNISNNKTVYIKLKGTKGDIVRVDLLNLSSAKFIDGYAIAQQITCPDYRWYKFDFSGKTEDMDQIVKIAISYNPAVLSKGSITIDEIVLGTVPNFTEVVPSFASKFFITDMSNDYYKGLSPETSLNTFKMGKDVFEATENPLADVGDGFGFTAFVNDAPILIDIDARRIVKVIAQVDKGDTIRVNLKSGLGYAFIDGYDYFQIAKTSEFAEYTFDFTNAKTGNFKEIIAADVSINPGKHDDKTFYIKDVQIGDDVCNARVASGVSKASVNLNNLITVYPNPSVGTVNVTTSLAGAFDLNIYTVSGNLIKTQKVTNGDQIKGLISGLYVFEFSSEQGSATTKVVVK
jgi:hypothetical protein